MDTNGHEFEGPASEEVYQIVGSAFEVLNELGHCLHEKPYENSLVVEFNARK